MMNIANPSRPELNGLNPPRRPVSFNGSAWPMAATLAAAVLALCSCGSSADDGDIKTPGPPAPSTPFLATLSLGSLTVGRAIAPQEFSNTGAGSLTSCTDDDEALPAGLTVEVAGDTCRISGTPMAETAGELIVRITARNSNGAGAGIVRLTVSLPRAPSLVDFSLGSLTVGRPIEPQDFANAGGGFPTSCTDGEGALPAGLSVEVAGDTCRISGTPMSVTAGELIVRITASNSGGARAASLRLSVRANQLVDSDNDGLIEIDTLAKLNLVRHDLTGRSLKESSGDGGSNGGCPATSCIGYELMADLDFDLDGDGATVNSAGALDSDDNAAWFDAAAGGWLPIGGCGADRACLDYDERTSEFADNTPFNAVFEGNGHAIANLAVARALGALGLFSNLGPAAEVRNLALNDFRLFCRPFSGVCLAGGIAGMSEGEISDSSAGGGVSGEGGAGSVGGLIGLMLGGRVRDSSSSGVVDGSDGPLDDVGGLVGVMASGLISGCSSSSLADGGGGYEDSVGGLVGWLSQGAIVASWASGLVDGGPGDEDDAGGLAGLMSRGLIVASRASGLAGGDSGDDDSAGGLVGWMRSGEVIASYATGAVGTGGGDMGSAGGLVGVLEGGRLRAVYASGASRGGSGDDAAGGLVGYSFGGEIFGAYATGDSSAGPAGDDFTGALIGLIDRNRSPSVADSFGFGASSDSGSGSAGAMPPAGVSAPASLTSPGSDAATAAPASWNRDIDDTLGAWDYGDATQNPALNFADYDGAATDFHCDSDAANAPARAILIPGCGTHIPGQR